MILILSGMIGSGKTSLAKILAKHYKICVFDEPVKNNKILPLFYKNPRKYAYQLQCFFSKKRFNDMKNALSFKNGILDRSIYEDEMFFSTMSSTFNCDSLEQKMYKKYLNELINNLPDGRPDLLIYLDISYKTAIKRIEKRGRPYESPEHFPYLNSYYKKLLKNYYNWFNYYKYSDKIKINVDNIDFVNKIKDKQAVLSLIDNKINKINLSN